MSELALTLARFSFLGLLWLFVIFALIALRRDMRGKHLGRPMVLALLAVHALRVLVDRLAQGARHAGPR